MTNICITSHKNCEKAFYYNCNSHLNINEKYFEYIYGYNSAVNCIIILLMLPSVNLSQIQLEMGLCESEILCPVCSFLGCMHDVDNKKEMANLTKCAYYWVDTRARNGVPSTALHGGTDSDGDTIYVGRAYHEGDWLPAKVIPNKDVAYVAYNGREHAKYEFQVLCEQKFQWVPSSGGYIPEHAVEGGRTGDGEPLYIGRAHHHGSLTVGKVHPSHGCCYIPYGGEEISHRQYEILVLQH